MTSAGEDDTECVDHPRSPTDCERYDDKKQRDGNMPLLAADAPPLLGRVQPHADAVAANDGERERVTDSDDDHRDHVAGDDYQKEVDERPGVGRVARTALRRRRLVDNIRQRTDRRYTSSGRPQPRTCTQGSNIIVVINVYKRFFYFSNVFIFEKR